MEIKYCNFCKEVTPCYRDDQLWNGSLFETYFCSECNQRVN